MSNYDPQRCWPCAGDGYDRFEGEETACPACGGSGLATPAGLAFVRETLARYGCLEWEFDAGMRSLIGPLAEGWLSYMETGTLEISPVEWAD